MAAALTSSSALCGSRVQQARSGARAPSSNRRTLQVQAKKLNSYDEDW